MFLARCAGPQPPAAMPEQPPCLLAGRLAPLLGCRHMRMSNPPPACSLSLALPAAGRPGLHLSQAVRQVCPQVRLGHQQHYLRRRVLPLLQIVFSIQVHAGCCARQHRFGGSNTPAQAGCLRGLGQAVCRRLLAAGLRLCAVQPAAPPPTPTSGSRRLSHAAPPRHRPLRLQARPCTAETPAPATLAARSCRRGGPPAGTCRSASCHGAGAAATASQVGAPRAAGGAAVHRRATQRAANSCQHLRRPARDSRAKPGPTAVARLGRGWGSDSG